MFAIRNVRSSDERRIALLHAFLLENPDPGVRPRPRTEIEKALETGFALIVEEEGAIVATSLVYKFQPADDGPVYAEIGTMRVKANGFGLQETLAKLNVLQIELEEHSPEKNETFAVVGMGTASEHVLAGNCLFEDWQPPSSLAIMRRDVGTPFNPEKRVLKATDAASVRAKRDLLSWSDRSQGFRTPKRDGRMVLELGWFDPSLLQDGEI